MAGINRITRNLVAVLDVLLTAHANDERLHGYAVSKRAGRIPSIAYPVLARLVDAMWATWEWEVHDVTSTRAPRRQYWLTPAGVEAARVMVRADRMMRAPEQDWDVEP